jgi:hypothetical protein
MRTILVALFVIAVTLSSTATRATAATCTSSVGPGIPPPAGLVAGQDGFHAAWYGQSGYMSLCPGAESVATVAYYNVGSRGWVSGILGQVAYLGTANPSPGQDQPSILGGDGTNGSPATGWPRYNRLAIQPAPYVGPGQVAWFQFKIRAPQYPGRYSIALKPLIEGAQWMEDYGVFWNVTVLNPDGSVPPPPVTIGNGTFVVGQQVPAGTYRTRTASSSSCYWERERGFSGSTTDIIANGISADPQIVTIASTDVGFKSSQCPDWTNDLSPLTRSTIASFGNGMFIVGVDIAAGTWSAPASSGCYWARLAGFSGESKDLIANDLGDGQMIVTISATDKGFESSRCGPWTKIG